MSVQHLRVAVDGNIATVTIARPERLNALDRDVLSELIDAFIALDKNQDVLAAVLTGDGKAFVAGADISSMRDMNAEQAGQFAELGHRLGALLEGLRFPVIAAINGFALGGGCELALACDFAYASEKAKLGQPEVKLGVIPGFGGTQRLARRVGIAKARELVFTGATIDAAEALRIGLVNAVFSPDDLLPKTYEAARAIAGMGPAAVRIAKRVLRDGEEQPLVQANAIEVRGFAECFQTADQKEGMGAFLEKRPAKFSDR